MIFSENKTHEQCIRTRKGQIYKWYVKKNIKSIFPYGVNRIWQRIRYHFSSTVWNSNINTTKYCFSNCFVFLICDSNRLKEVDINLMKVSSSTACGSFDNS